MAKRIRRFAVWFATNFIEGMIIGAGIALVLGLIK
jgi:hypothetical protein